MGTLRFCNYLVSQTRWAKARRYTVKFCGFWMIFGVICMAFHGLPIIFHPEVCIALMQGISLSPGDIVVLCAMATLCTMGTAPVPSASLVLLATLLSMLNIPVTATFLDLAH